MIFSCGYGESFNTSDAKYFLKHPHLKWVTTDITNAYRLPGVIPVINPMGTFYVGRMHLKTTTGFYKSIGRIFNGRMGYLGPLTNFESTTTSEISGDADVLVCQE